MFVAIDNTEMNIPQVTEWIIKTRDANGEVISPEFAMEVLSKTNHFGHIKMVLKNINDNCSDEEKKTYKDFVLACVDGREMSPQALAGLRELADVCGVRDEFETLNEKSKSYSIYDCAGVTIKSKEEIEALEGTDKVELSGCDLSGVKDIKFREGAEVSLKGARDLPSDVDFSQCEEVVLRKCNLAGVKKLKFKKGAKVDLYRAKNLPDI